MELSDGIVQDARLVGAMAHRSIAEQIEFWAQLGRAIDSLIEGNHTLALHRAAQARPLSECLASVDSDEGRQRVRAYLASQPFPHYEPAPGSQGLLVRIEEDGTRTLGRFVDREFRAFE